ncbi:MAG: VTT domain-containing protein [Rhodospirillales bacterium]
MSSRSQLVVRLVADLATAVAEPIAVEGRNCQAVVTADRVAFLTDAQAYFRCFKAAALGAQRSILIIGWDINSRTLLEFPDEADPSVPNELGPFLDFLVARRKRLVIRVLIWDSPLIFAMDREWAVRARFDWFSSKRLCLALDDQHPFGASQHQKLVVIDDSLAFLGGIDLTARRLDGSEHRPNDPRRRDADGARYEAVHDAQVAVDGAAAWALAGVARDRWTRATGERLRPVRPRDGCWPEELAVHMRQIGVAIARTYPAWKGRPEVREIEALFVDAIRHAKTNVYIESQYFCADKVARAIIDRLTIADGPEFVVVLPPQPTGWLEQATMGSKQQRLLAGVRAVGRPDRFRVYTPVVGNTGEVGVNIHSKVIIVDGSFVTIGSGNLNNRSMGLDAECNLAIEGDMGSDAQRAIKGFRDRLIAEHLDVAPDRLAAEIEACGSLVGAIEALRGPGRSLLPFPEAAPEAFGSIAGDLELVDPEGPAEPERIAHELVADEPGRMTVRSGLVRLGVVVAGLLAVAALWRWGPLSELASNPRAVGEWARTIDRRLVVAVFIAAYVVGGLLMFPVMVLIAATGLFFGPIAGMLVAGAGALVSATAGYGAGALLGRPLLRRLAGGRVSRISHHLARRGILSMMIIRVLPIAPFTLINLAAGASHIRFRDFLVGTLFGMAPGVAAITIFSGQLVQAIRSPDVLNLASLVVTLFVIAAAAAYCWRKFLHNHHRPAGAR